MAQQHNKCQIRFSLIQSFLVLLLATVSYITHAAPPVSSLDSKTTVPIDAPFEYLEDPDSSLEIKDLVEFPATRWTGVEGGSGSFGFSDSQYWIRLGLHNLSQRHENFVFEISYPLLDLVSFYAVRSDGRIRYLDVGDMRPFGLRDIHHPSMLFRIKLDPGETADLYARVRTNGSVILPVRLWLENAFFEFAAQEQKFHFFYYGALSVIILINLAVFISLREKLYLFYCLATLGYLLFFVTSRGYGAELLFPNAPSANSQLFLSSMPFLALFSLLFAREFLKTQEHSPRMDWCLRAMIYFEYFNMVAAVIFSYNVAVKISAVSAFVLFAVLAAAGPITWFAKKRSGVFFTIAWVPLTLGFVATGGRSAGFLPNNFLTEYAMQIGSGLEAFILMLALADRLYREREEKIRAQANSLDIEKQRHEAQSLLADAMMRDAVTQLPNRNRYEWMLKNTFREEPKGHFIVGLARVTRLDEIARTLGLASSESVLKTIAKEMNEHASSIPGIVSTESALGEAEVVFQLSGDTFGVLIRQNTYQHNVELYEAILKRLSLPIEVDDLKIELEPRFGAALYPKHGRESAQLIRNAHVAMESTTHARDQVGYYDSSLDIYNESRLTLMADLRNALRKDETTLYYQPKLNLRTGKVEGLEALIRWQHPQQGFIPPVEFILFAEETGVINELTLWVFEKAFSDLKTLQGQGYLGSVSINISARDLLSVNLFAHCQSLLDKYDVAPARVILELTETAAMDDPEAGLAVLKKLTSLGLRLSIDDFGAGYSSLSYLKRHPISEIKLDRSLIHDICTNENSRIIVQTSIDMAHSLGYVLVAEGVEDEGTKDLLKELNCDKLQGFWFCKPLPLPRLENWLRENGFLG